MRYRWIVFFLTLLMILMLTAASARAAEVIPPNPSPHYIVDDAKVMSPQVVQAIDRQLEQFERDTSNQVVVAIYGKMQSTDDIAAYAVRVFQAWRPGQKKTNNGILLLVFIDDHKMNITTGYGLEGPLPDATCKDIIDNEIAPRFKANDYDGGIQAGVTAMLAATRGEYKGSGSTNLKNVGAPAILIAIFAFIFLLSILRGIFGTAYAGGGRIPWWAIMLMSSGSGRRGGWGGGGGGGGWSGGGGGGFSGGGGSTGGGGASGSW